MDALTILYQGLDRIQQAICTPELKLLRKEFYNNCDQTNKELADKINAISWDAYKQEMAKQMKAILEVENRQRIKAIYYEYDDDNEWEGAIFACLSYNADPYVDEDWACDWEKLLQTPDVPEYESLGIYFSPESEQSAWISLYGILVLTDVYADIVHSLQLDLPCCIALHGQSIITRIP